MLKTFEVTASYYNSNGIPDEYTGLKGSVYTVVGEVQAADQKEAIEKHRLVSDKKYGENAGIFESAHAYESGSIQNKWFK